MPSFNSKVQLSTAAQNSNTVLSDVDRIKGAFKVYTANEMNSAHVNYFTDGQIVYVSDSGSLYRANVTLANPGEGIFEDSVSFSEFSFDSGSFTSASFDSGNSTLTLFGPDLSGSAQVSMSVDLSDLSGGSTDISDLNTFTGSAETRLDDLEAATGSYITNAQTGSFLVPSDTGSLLITGSVSSNVITLEKGDGTSFTLTVDTGSGGGASVGTLQQVTEQGHSTNVSMSIQGIEIFSATETDGDESGSLFIGADVANRLKQLNNGTNTTLNTVIGFEAASRTNFLDSRNTVVGAAALKGVTGGDTNSNNTALGALSLHVLQDGSGKNTAVGHQSLVSLKSGSRMVAVGNDAGYNVVSGSNSIFIGELSNPASTVSENEIVIGTNTSGKGNNTVTIGNSNVTDNYFTGNLTGSITDVYIADWGSVSASLASLEAGGGSGDITAVLAGDGISGGADSGDATLTLDTGSAHFIAGVLKSGLFRLTGSVYATTNDIAVTGSLDVNFVESTQEFRVSSQSVTQFSINNEGVAVLAPRSIVPTAVSGGMYFSTDGNFYFGIQQ